MNRAEMTSKILTWEAVATRAQTMAAELRTQLAEDVRADPASMAQISADADDIMAAVAAALDEPAGIDNP